MVPPSSQDEALASYSVSGEAPRSILKFEMLLGTLDATPKSPNIPVSLQGFTFAAFVRKGDLGVSSIRVLYELGS